jgi:hypothetical protein
MTEKFYMPWENQVDDSFKEHAACRGMNPELFMPGVGENGKEAKVICNGTPAKKGHPGTPPCPVKQECLEYALQLPGITVGVFGGTTERERRLLKRQIISGVNYISNKPVAVNAKRPMRHGTSAGYEQHRRRKEPPCDACKEAHAQASRGWRNRDNDPVTMPTLKTLVHLVHAENARASRTPHRSRL